MSHFIKNRSWVLALLLVAVMSAVFAKLISDLALL
jgi:hypothetical protein